MTNALAWISLRGELRIDSKKLKGVNPTAVHGLEGELLIAGWGGLMRREATPSGRSRWVLELPGMRGVLAIDTPSGSILVHADDGLACVDAASGGVRWWNHGVTPINAAMVGEQAQVLERGSLRTLAGATGATLGALDVPVNTDRLCVYTDGALWLEDGTEVLGERVRSGFRLDGAGTLESHVRSVLEHRVVRHVQGLELEVASTLVCRGQTTRSLRGDFLQMTGNWRRAGPAWGSELLLWWGEESRSTGNWYAVEFGD